MNGIFDMYDLEIGDRKENGIATISAFEIKNDFSHSLENLRAIRNGGSIFGTEEGKYIRLSVHGQLMMSDTPMEKRSNSTFVYRANGHVLIAGLGVGLIINALKEKIETGEVSKITVVEAEKDVIDLVSPYLKDFPSLEIVHSDIHEFAPAKGLKYDTIYFDIWPDISEDNLEEIKRLHNKFKFKLNRENPKAWMNSWMRDYLVAQRRRERSYSYRW